MSVVVETPGRSPARWTRPPYPSTTLGADHLVLAVVGALHQHVWADGADQGERRRVGEDRDEIYVLQAGEDECAGVGGRSRGGSGL